MRGVALLAVAALSGCAMDTSPDPWRIGEGELRREAAPEDAAFDNGDLVRNFRDIALRAEFSEIGSETRALPLTRWEDDIDYVLRGGSEEDHEAIAAHAAYLADLTGRGFQEAKEDDDANMIIIFLPDEGRADAARAAAREIKAFELERIVDVWARRSRDACIVMTRQTDAAGPIVASAILIRDELTPLYREVCIIEELTQAMGLLNDSPDARPSIFNDDQEFAMLTTHDEHLLRILYDERLEPGMSDEEALPLVAEIADELRPDEAVVAEGP